MTRFKFCGLMDADAVAAANGCGASHIGFVLTESRRRVSLDRAAELAALARSQSARPLIVGVFTDEPWPEIVDAAVRIGLDVIQLSGSANADAAVPCSIPIWRTVQLHGPADVHGLPAADRILLDTAGAPGGSGRVFDWTWLRGWSGGRDVVLAGGLTPENVSVAIETVRPWAVDVSSGIELGGRKSAERMRAFADAVRRTDSELAKRGGDERKGATREKGRRWPASSCPLHLSSRLPSSPPRGGHDHA